MNRIVNTRMPRLPTPQHLRVRRVHNRIRREPRNVTSPQANVRVQGRDLGLVNGNNAIPGNQLTKELILQSQPLRRGRHGRARIDQRAELLPHLIDPGRRGHVDTALLAQSRNQWG